MVAKKRGVITACQQEDDTPYRWFKHRLLAVDGTKLNLPRPLMGWKYTPTDTHYPQGLLSCLYQLKSKFPFTLI